MTTRHRVYHVRPSRPGDPGYNPTAKPPFSVCAECGRPIIHIGRKVRGTEWVHA